MILLAAIHMKCRLDPGVQGGKGCVWLRPLL